MEDLKQQMLITGEGLCLLDKQNRVRRTVVILSLKEDKCEKKKIIIIIIVLKSLHFSTWYNRVNIIFTTFSQQLRNKYY